MTTVTANELKVQGVKALEKSLEEDGESIITVRGKEKYIVMDMDRYNYLRECELEAAFIESMKDLENKDYFVESVDEHISRLKNEI